MNQAHDTLRARKKAKRNLEDFLKSIDRNMADSDDDLDYEENLKQGEQNYQRSSSLVVYLAFPNKTKFNHFYVYAGESKEEARKVLTSLKKDGRISSSRILPYTVVRAYFESQQVVPIGRAFPMKGKSLKAFFKFLKSGERIYQNHLKEILYGDRKI